MVYMAHGSARMPESLGLAPEKYEQIEKKTWTKKKRNAGGEVGEEDEVGILASAKIPR